MSTSELFRLLPGLDMPTVLIDIVMGYLIDLKEHVPDRDWTMRHPYIYLKPYLTLDVANGIYEREPVKIDQLKNPKAITNRKRARISKCFIYEYIRDNLGDIYVFTSLHWLAGHIMKHHTKPGRTTYKIKICHTVLTLNDHFFETLCGWILKSLYYDEEVMYRLQ